jgi:hypothetical protein
MENIEYRNLLKKMGWTFFSDEYPNSFGDYTSVIVVNNDGYEGRWRWTDESKQRILDRINSGKESYPVIWQYEEMR